MCCYLNNNLVFFKAGIICVLGYLLACSNSKKAISRATISTDRSDSLAGSEIIKKSNCLTCHKIKEKLLAPSFTDIALKYDLTSGNVDRLSKKIITGGKRVWSELPMIPHPEISEKEAQLMVKYILVLKK